MKNNTLSTTINPVKHTWMPVDIQIIHHKNKGSPQLIHIQPITELCHVIGESPNVSPPLYEAPVEGERLTCLLIA